MNRWLVGITALLLTAGACWAELSIVGDTKIQPYKLVRLKALGHDEKAGLLWRIDPRKGVSKATGTPATLEFVAPPGEYIVSLLAVKLDDDGATTVQETEVTVTIGEPGPGPGPTPPVPPGPTPPPPIPPDDPLVKALKAAYATETASDKATTCKALAALYRQAGQDAFLNAPATWGDLFTAMSQAARTLEVSGKVPAVQQAIAAELKAALPSERQRPITPDGRATAKTTFARIAAALEALVR